MGEAPNEQTTDHDLGAVIPRLVDLQRKCRSVGSRSDEPLEMETRIESIMQRLQTHEAADAEPIPYAALARELYAVERFFESNGFLSISREVAHVERTLERFALPDEPDPTATPEIPRDSTPGTASEPMIVDSAEGSTAGPPRWAVPKPLAAVIALSVVAIVVCVVLIVRFERPAHPTVERARLAPTPAPTAPPPPPRAVPRDPDAGPAPGAVLAEEVGRARIALGEGDIDQAIEHLSQAALVDANHATVLGTARQIVELLVDRADAAAEGGLWEIAALTLTRASRIATRFGLDTHRIEETAHRHSQMDRFTLIQPTDTDAIRAAAGKRVTVFLKDGSKQESIIKTTQAGQLLLDEDTTVRGGAMYYVEKVPLADIDYLKVWGK